MRPKEPMTNVKVTLKTSVSLKGTIVDSSGTPIPETRVKLKHLMSIRHITQADLEEGRWPRGDDPNFISLHGFRETIETTTDAQGRFELKGLVANRGAFLEVAHPEYVIKNAYAATVEELDPETAAKVKRNVQTGEMSVSLEPGYRLRVVALDAETGEPVPNVRYALTHQGYRTPPRHRSEDGVIAINHLKSPQYRVLVFPPEESSYLAYSQSLKWPVGERLKEVEVKLRKGIRVRGRVVSRESKAGISDVEVLARGPQFEFKANVPRQYAASPVPTDAEGFFDVYCPPGDHTFQPRGRIRGFLNSREAGAVSRIVSVTEQGPQHEPEISIAPAPRFRLIVTTPDGKPVHGASVRAKAHNTRNSYFPIEGTTDEKGEYLLDQLFMTRSAVQELLAEEVVIRDQDNRHGARLLLKRPEADAPIEQRIEVRVEQLGTVIGRSIDEQTGEPVAGTSIYLYKREHEQSSSSSTGEFTTTGTDGRFELKGVLPDVQHSLSMSHKKFKTPNGIHLRFQVTDDKPYDFGDIKLGSLTPPNVPELEQVRAPDVSGLTVEEAFETLKSSHEKEFKTYRKDFDRLKDKYSSADIVARREPTPAYCSAFLNLAQLDPQSDTALKSCLWIVNARRISGSEKQSRESRAEAARLLQKHFLGRPEMAQCISVAIEAFVKPEDRRRLYSSPDLLAEAADALIEASPHRDVRARALMYVVERYMLQLKRQGAPSSKRIESCRKYLTRIKNDYPEYKHFLYGTYGKAAERLLYDLDHMLVGKTPPDLVATDVTGKAVKLSDYRGKLVIVDFWRGGSGPVTGDHYNLKHILEKSGEKVAVLGILSSPKEQVLEEIEKHKMAYPVFADGKDGPLFTLWNVHAWPTTFLLDENGVIMHRGHRDTALANILLEQLAAKDGITRAVNRLPE